MNLDAIPLFSMLRGKLGYLTQREQVIAQNVANADTPGFVPTDMKPFTFESQLSAAKGAGAVPLAATQPGHMGAVQAQAASTTWGTEAAPDSEGKLDGNQVSLEDQMVKMNQARMDYDTAISFYQQSMSLIRTAAKRPGS